jgi:hypothetical protein
MQGDERIRNLDFGRPPHLLDRRPGSTAAAAAVQMPTDTTNERDQAEKFSASSKTSSTSSEAVESSLKAEISPEKAPSAKTVQEPEHPVRLVFL